MDTFALCELMIKFVTDTISGFESGIFKSFNGNSEIIKTSIIKNVELKVCVEYFNSAYKSLILEDDPYIVEKFSQMHREHSHSYICLLNIIFNIATRVIEHIERKNLNTNSYSDYMESISREIKNLPFMSPLQLEQFVTHKCTGIDIKTCNPNEPMFYIGTTHNAV